ncbi:hypothetical protein FZEAL_9111 [Fusarium zealandicum]|uniref:N-acetyltransferase domain-containing protein n=1 Tax=Fusarium zealandicum TaxID=1053134 RepID=A0A8H4XGU1_9HYPO|nr:hypothetical protein FZEAL_9111 [Fusarium zealandicum]
MSTMITDELATAFSSKRLLYRAVGNNEADKRFLYTQIVNNPINTALSDLTLVLPRSEGAAEKLIEGLSKATMGLMVCLREESSPGEDGMDKTDMPPTEPIPIGFVVLGWGGTPFDHARHRSTSIGIYLAVSYQGRGYGTEIINWTLDWAFRHGGYHRVGIRTVSYNVRAQHLYKKLGFVEEGRNRESHWYDRKWHDTVSYGLLEGEWENIRGPQGTL